MNLKWKKKYLGPILGLVGAAVLIGGVYLYSSSNIQPDHQKEFKQTSKKVTKPKEKAIDLSGDYVSNERDEAKIEKKGKAWKIDYQTADGKVSAEFSTDWKVEGSNKVSTGKMKKSDGNTNFTVTVRVFKYKTDKKPLITVTMSDKNPDHEMVFANREDFFKSTDPNDVVLDGNLSPFEGAYSNDTYEKEIADSGFKLYGYTPEEYYQNKTNAFPSIVNGETGWTFWSGGTRASYLFNKEKEPKKRKGYYEVYFTGANATAIQGQEQTLYLIPAGVTGPDGVASQERRILFGDAAFRDYHLEWWKAYPQPKKEKDLDIAAINGGDFSSLAGTWRNGKGAEIVIQADGKVKGQGSLKAVADSDKKSKIPYVEMKMGETGAAIGLLKIGFQNPDGDQSDTSKPRLVVTQSAGNYPADQYFYRQ